MYQALAGCDLDMGEFWRHSIAVAVAAESIGNRACKVSGDCFTAGLLHDTGKLVVSNYLTPATDLHNGCSDLLTFDMQEKSRLGINHAEVGAKILEQWNFPQPLVDAVLYHHAPKNNSTEASLTDIVHVADALCISAGIGIGSDGLQYRLFPRPVERLELTHEKIEAVLSETLEKMEKFEKIIEMGSW
jgi:putative nucleotidyltransferase with HDIG domain